MVRRARAAAILVCLLGVALVGCAEVPPPIPTEEEVKAAALPPDYRLPDDGMSDELGSIVGYVVDDEHLPIKGALVGFREPYIADVTDASGAFEIGQLKPGSWDLYVIHLGHKADGLRVHVEAGKAAKVTFVLPVLPVEEPWHHVLPFEGRIDYSVRLLNFGTTCCASGRSGSLELADKPLSLTTALVGARWVPTSNLFTGLTTSLDVPDTRQGPFLTVGGADSPILGVADSSVLSPVLAAKHKECNENKCRFSWSVNPYTAGGLTNPTGAYGFAYEQSFEVFVALFYRKVPSETYSPFPD